MVLLQSESFQPAAKRQEGNVITKPDETEMNSINCYRAVAAATPRPSAPADVLLLYFAKPQDCTTLRRIAPLGLGQSLRRLTPTATEK